MGHQLNYCPYVDDKSMRKEVMNVHQPIIPTITTILPTLSTMMLRNEHVNMSVSL